MVNTEPCSQIVTSSCKALYLGVNRYDKSFVKQLVDTMPRYIQTILMSEYRKRLSRFDANTYIRTTVLDLTELIPPILQNKFDATEDDLKSLAIEGANRCSRFTNFWYLFNSNASGVTNALPETQKMYDLCADYLKASGLKPPIIDKKNNIEAAIRRMKDEYWWKQNLRKLLKRSREAVFIHLEKVNKFKGLYCSNFTARQRIHQKHMQDIAMQRITAINENGDSFSLAELSAKNVSNPINRRNELMTRIRGFENLSKELEHMSLFVTMTCPSKYHNAFAKSGQRNPNWGGLLPSDSQSYLCLTWSRIRAELSRQNIQIYGLRIAEPQHDGTPHWHLCLFFNISNLKNIKEVMLDYNLAEDGDERGAKENRVDFIEIDPARGSASGYIAKYICKNIDGSNFDKGVYGENPIEAAQRVEAWASCWGIRQFQQIGGVSVTVWRELRRVKKQTINHGAIARIFDAADSANWAEFTTLMGGVFCKRKDQVIRPFYDFEICKTNGVVKSNWFDGLPIKKLKGVIAGSFEVITRIHQWVLKRAAEPNRSYLEFCK
jgi:hypothetical protein